jgi:hypothetical protein
MGQVDIRHPSVVLQIMEDASVDSVQFYPLHIERNSNFAVFK